MTIRDVSADFAYQPPTSSSVEVCTGSIVGTAQTYIGPNSYDTGNGAAFLTELTALDQILSAGGQNFYVEGGTGQGMKLVIDWVVAPVGSGTIRSQLITAPTSSLNSPTVMIDFGFIPIAAVPAGYRQIAALPRSSAWQRWIGLQITTSAPMSAGAYVAWIGETVDSVVMGYESSFQIK